jgi:hypothetical protein
MHDLFQLAPRDAAARRMMEKTNEWLVATFFPLRPHWYSSSYNFLSAVQWQGLPNANGT